MTLIAVRQQVKTVDKLVDAHELASVCNEMSFVRSFMNFGKPIRCRKVFLVLSNTHCKLCSNAIAMLIGD